jgi:hypothetical protein
MDPTPAILKRYYYSYDSAGNRTAEQIDDATTAASYNNMNQLVSQQVGGTLVFKGTVSEPANVTVGGRPATVTADNKFEGQAVVPGGTGQVAVTATDPSGNTRTSTYQVSQAATSKAFTYDPTATRPRTGRAPTSGMPRIGSSRSRRVGRLSRVTCTTLVESGRAGSWRQPRLPMCLRARASSKSD